jgi:hypothetical protein
MKRNKHLLLVGTIATIATGSIAWADKEPAAEPMPAVEEPASGEVVVEEPAVEEPATDETLADGPGAEEPGSDDSVVEITLYQGGEDGEAPEVVVCDKGEEGVPVHECVEPGGPEVQRGEDRGGDPDLIFQTTALNGGAEAPTDKATGELGHDERAADIQDGESRGTAVKPQSKGPVALVKKGRVFLR